MKSVFSFTLFGNDPKYTKGLLKNIRIIEEKFPGWEVWVYCGDGVPEDVYFCLYTFKCVKLIPTNMTGMVNKFYRFFAIDDPSVDTCIVRDADSRIYERDEACIREFLHSEKLVHIIRDHPNHHHRMMAGMWGIKREAVEVCLHGKKIKEMYNEWSASQPPSGFWSDTQFLCEALYPFVVYHSLIHDEIQQFEPPPFKTPFPSPLIETHFIGQVYEISPDGHESCKYPFRKD